MQKDIKIKQTSSLEEFAKENYLDKEKAGKQWEDMSEADKKGYIANFWKSKEQYLDQKGRIHRKSKYEKREKEKEDGWKKFIPIASPLIILIFAVIMFYFAVPQKQGANWKTELVNFTEVKSGPLSEETNTLLKEREEPYELEMEVGKGIDIYNNIYDDMIDFNLKDRELPKPDIKTFVEIIAKKKQKSAILNAMANSEIPTNGIKEATNYIHNLKANKTSLYIVIASTIVSKRVKVKNPDIKHNIKEDFINNSLTASEFIQKYGTHYVSGYINAAQFIGIVEINTNTLDDKYKIRNVVNKTSFPDVLSQLAEQKIPYNKNIKIYVRGVNSQFSESTIGDLISAHEEFVKEAKIAELKPFTVSCTPISLLPSFEVHHKILQELKSIAVI